MAAKRIGKIAMNNSALFICDMQEAFRPTIQYMPQVINVCNRLLKAGEHLEMPILVTEQYPKGLGHTVSEMDVSQHKVFPKSCFSMMLPDFQAELKKHKDVKSIVICGIEAHACVQQTVFDLLEQDYEVHVVVDACSSRSMVDRMYALERMRSVGAHLTTSESILLGLVKDAAHPKFKPIQKIIWDSAPDSGLLTGKPQEGTPV